MLQIYLLISIYYFFIKRAGIVESIFWLPFLIEKGFKKLNKESMNSEQERIVAEYKNWAKSHPVSWETDNLIGNLLKWHKDYKGIYAEKERNKAVKEAVKGVSK